MNKIYKVIWLKVKNCYVVASELAKNHTKSPKSGAISRSVVAGVLACVLSCGAIIHSVYASYTAGGASGSGSSYTAIGEYAIADGNWSVAYGVKSRALSSGATAIGDNAYAYGGTSLSVGTLSIAHGAYSVALGRGYTSSNSAGSIAIGAVADTFANGAVAIGVNSNASEEDVISFGHKIGDSYIVPDTPGNTNSDYYTVENVRTYEENLFRRVINVADGTDNHDVSTVGQLNDRAKFVSVNGIDTDSNYLGDGATGTNAIAIGVDSVVSGNNSIAVGVGHQVTGNNSGTFGDPNIVNGDNSYVVGNNSTVHANIKNAFVLGSNTSVSNGLPANWDTMTDAEKEAWTNSLETTDVKEGVVALGNNISVSLDNKSSNSRSSNSEGTPEIEHVVAVGDNVVIGEENAIGIGHRATATALNTIAMGDDVQATMEGAIAVGHSTRATNAFSNALGYLAQATGEGAGAFGQDAQATGNFTVAFGRSTRASAESATAIGNTAHAISQSSIAIGTSAIANGGANTNAVAIGRGATIGSDTQGYGETLAVGSGTNVQNTFGSALGSSASVTGQKGTAVGYNASVTASNAIALGADSVANVADTVSVGSTSVTRKIVNVTNGTANTDVSTVEQTGNQLDLSGSTLTLKNVNGTVLDMVTLSEGNTYTAGNGLSLSGTTFSVNTNGLIASGNAGVLNGGTVYSEVRPIADGTFAKKANTTATNITALDTAAKNAIKSLSVSGQTITYTKGDGTTGTITTQDNNTTYSAATSSALGLVKTGANITNSSGTISLTKDNVVTALGYTPPTTDTNTTYAAMSADELTTGTATSSRSITAKVLGDYVKNKTNDKISNLSINGNIITYTKGDGTTGTITTPNTTYSAGSGLTLSGTTLSVNTNGTATSGNTGVVSGGTLYNAIKDKVQYDSDDKSKISLGGTRGTVLSNLLGTTITVDSTNAVTGAQLYAVKQDIAGFVENIQKNSDNIRSLNSSVTSALSSVAASGLLVDTMDVVKADASLNNLTDGGKQILKQYAANAVQEYMATQQGSNSAPMAPMMYAGNPNTLSVTDAGNGSLHVGEGSYVNGTSSIAIGVGNQVNANNSGAFGDPSVINADESYVLGNDDTINTGATGSFIVGNDGVSDAKGGLLFGSNTKATVDAEDGMALGNRAEVSAKNAIALGSGSIADADNTLSIGNTNLKRKIVNVADGDISQNSNEAVTGAQLFVTNEKVQKNTEAIEKKADVDAGNINTSDWASKLGIGKIEADNTDLVTGGTVYNAIKGINTDNGLVQASGDAITIGANSTASVIDVSNANGQGRVISGVITDVDDATSAANVGYVNQISENIVRSTNAAFQKMDNRINKAGANAAAIASLPTPTFDGDEKWAFSAGVGHYHGETAASAGAFYKPQDNVIVRVGGSFGNGDEMVGAGMSVSLNKGNTPTVSKAQLVRTINAQAGQIQQQANEIQTMKVVHQSQMDDMRAIQQADMQRIAELEAQLVRVTAKLDELAK